MLEDGNLSGCYEIFTFLTDSQQESRSSEGEIQSPSNRRILYHRSMQRPLRRLCIALAEMNEWNLVNQIAEYLVTSSLSEISKPVEEFSALTSKQLPVFFKKRLQSIHKKTTSVLEKKE